MPKNVRIPTNEEKIEPLSQPLTPFDAALSKIIDVNNNVDTVDTCMDSSDAPSLTSAGQAKTIDIGVKQRFSLSSNNNAATGNDHLNDKRNCSICRVDVNDNEKVNSIMCATCHTWNHRSCLFMAEEPSQQRTTWHCTTCLSMKAN